MKKIIVFLLVVSFLLSGCGAGAAQDTNAVAGSAVTFSDDLGRTVTVADPQRVAALLGSFAQLWMLAGGTVCAAADDAWDDFQLDLAPETVDLGKTKALNLELLLAAEPDLVLASTNTKQNLEWQETMEAAGITVAYFDVSDFSDYLRVLNICTDITGRKDLYQLYGVDVQTEIDTVLDKSRRRLENNDAPTILLLRASASSIHAKCSDGNVLGEMLASLGCVNIADSDEMLLENLSIEHILISDPDLIFVVQHGDDTEGTKAHMQQFIAENPLWSQLRAVQNDRVYYMDKALFSLKPNHRWGEAYELVEEILSNG